MKTGHLTFLVCLFSLFLSSAAWAEALVRVCLAEGLPNAEITIQDRFAVYEGNELTVRSETPIGIFQVPREAKLGPFRIVPDNHQPIVFNRRSYRGEIHFFYLNNAWTVVNVLPVESYLRGVVGEEMMASWPLEALKAQAVAARTFAYAHLNQYPQKPFDLYCTVKDQVYGGITSETNASLEAVNATRGEILTYRGAPIQALFCDSTGGYTENSVDVWSYDFPYLKGVPDYDQAAPRYLWQRLLTAKDLQSLADIGEIIEIKPSSLSETGRVKQLQLVGTKGTRELTGAQFRSALKLNSTLFSVAPTAKGFLVVGRGFGHGVGMSQWGAKAMALAGHPYDRILAHYYRNTVLEVTKTSRSDRLY